MDRNGVTDAVGALRADTFRQFGAFSWRNLLVGAMTMRAFRALVTMRLCQMVSAGHPVVRASLPLFRVLHRTTTHVAGIDLSWRTSVGPGLAIAHGRALVVSPGARIGSNVTLFQGVTLGRRDRISQDEARETEYPTLEDEVWVGPYAIIVGGVTIGRGSRVAGGAFVAESVPPHSTVSGNPAIVVRSSSVPDVRHRAPV